MPDASQDPQLILINYQRALRDFQRTVSAVHTAQEDLDVYRVQRADETQAGIKAREKALEEATAEQREKRRVADQLKSQVDNLMKGVEDGTVVVPEPTPGDEAAAAEINRLREELAAQEERLRKVAADLDSEEKGLQ